MGAQAVGLLTEMGYTNVGDYSGGLAEWMEAGGAIEPRAMEVAGARAETTDIVARASSQSEDDARLTASAKATAVRRSFMRRRKPRATPWSIRFVDALGDQTVGALFGFWLATIAGFGVVYWLIGLNTELALRSGGGPIASDARGLLSALYFSAVTATSVGYGDIVPVGLQRPLAIAESVAGLVIFGCLISKFVSRRQEQLIGEIHRIAFDERLGRVRTNLHLVRTEIQATVRLCEGRDVAPPAAVARMESIAMVFVGELHTVHDLLYEPQRPIDEAVLEAILASLAAVFREFSELLACVPAVRVERPPAMGSSLSAMSRLAREICGDCVPRDYAPALRTWMDDIQRMALAIASQP